MEIGMKEIVEGRLTSLEGRLVLNLLGNIDCLCDIE